MAENTLAIFYHPDAYDVQNHKLMGRRAAGKNFLSAWIDRNGAGTLYCHAAGRQHFVDFSKIAMARGASGSATWIPQDNPDPLAQVGALYYPGPDIAPHAWRRFKRAPNAWSVIGITHTICTKRVMDGITELVSAPLEPWDAVICTSRAVRDSVEYQMAAQREHLARRLGATKFPTPQLPIIPLGIHTDQFAPDPELRATTRARYAIGPDDIAILFAGRLDRIEKTHPAAMFIALERAAASGGKLHMFLAGSFAKAGDEAVWARDMAAWAPSVTFHIVDGRDDEKYAGVWHAADIFMSLVDNIQESFGLTVVEAMAAGLPCIVSDWDGYRDTVRDGVDGFCIPTLIPPAAMADGAMDQYSARIDGYGEYLAQVSSMVVIDIAAAAAALTKLITDKDLRRRMGDAARKRAVEQYDWRVVLNDYQRLIDDLAGLRRGAPVSEFPKPYRWPARLSPFDMFGTFATRRLRGEDSVRAGPAANAATLEYIAAAEKHVIGDQALFIRRSLGLLAAVKAPQSATLSALLHGSAEEARPLLLWTILVLAKFGLLVVEGK